MKKSFAVSVSALLLLGIVPLISSASADPGVSISFVPPLFASGGTTEVRIAAPPTPESPIVVTRIGVVYPDVDSDADTFDGDFSVPASPLGCLGEDPIAADGNAGDTMYVARDADGQRLGGFFPAGDTGYMALKWGDGDPLELSFLNNVDPPTDESIIATDPEAANPPESPFTWDEFVGGGPDSSAGTGVGTAFVCAFNDNNLDGTFNAGDTGGSITQSFIISLPVGGELLPINTTALLIAGISSNALWMLPTLATIAGVSFVLLRFQVTKKNN